MTATPSPDELTAQIDALLGFKNEVPRIPNLARQLLTDAAALIRELVWREKWQPIETAPKDGSTIILWSRYQSEPVTAAWAPRGRWASRWDGTTVIEAQGDTYTDYAEPSEPTHWRPLPAPPVEAK